MGSEAERVWHKLREIFDSYDKDGSGDLDVNEMTLVLKDYAKGEGTARSRKAVERELNSCMAEYDIDGGGTLSWPEFTKMVLENSSTFKLHFSDDVKANLMERISLEPSKGSSHSEARRNTEDQGNTVPTAAVSDTNSSTVEQQAEAPSASDSIIPLVMETFRILDRDNDGALDWREIRPFVAFNFEGRAVSAHQAKAFVHAFDADQKGSLSAEEYQQILVGGNLKDNPQRQRQCLTDLKAFLRSYSFDSPPRADESTAAEQDPEIEDPCAEVAALLEENFALLDYGKDGRLDWREISPFVAFNFKGRRVTDQQAKVFVEAFDSERKGSLNRTDFKNIIFSGNLRNDPQAQLQCLQDLLRYLKATYPASKLSPALEALMPHIEEIFAALDVSQSGMLSPTDLLLFVNFNFPDQSATLASAEKLVATFDRSQCGHLSLEDFSQIFFSGNLQNKPDQLKEMLESLLAFVQDNVQ